MDYILNVVCCLACANEIFLCLDQQISAQPAGVASYIKLFILCMKS